MDLSHFDLLGDKVRALVESHTQLRKINGELERKVDDLELALLENEETIKALQDEKNRQQQEHQTEVEALRLELETTRKHVESILEVLKDVEVTQLTEIEAGGES